MSEKETREFQAEVKQLLHLMINSLYSNKEIFLRELVSNAADACDKLRFEAVQDGDLMEGDDQLRIQVEHDAQARTVTIRDNGIGMSRDEVVENIGTIAHSGTRRFLNQLSGDQAADAKLIGEFGVGFYSAFIVADRVTLTTRRAGQPRDAAVRWESEGLGEYSIETVDRAQRGTEVVLHLREGEDEFLDQWRLRHVITRYSDHIDIPVELKVERPSDDDSESGGAAFEQINRASALWTRPKSEISDDDYTELYKHVAHDFEDPLAWTHNRVEGRYEYISLLYIPRRAPFDLYTQERSHGVKLYVKRVFILDDASELLPRYLRFVRGVIDSNDLPLNVSRELLQGSRVVDSIRSGSTKKVLGLLGELAGEDSDRYRTFWEQFGKVLKEGIVEDPTNRDALAKLLRFASTKGDGAEQTVSVADYVGRMKEGQDTIYYLTADSYAAASGSPHLEVFRKNDVEVLLLYDRVDEWLLSQLSELDGKPLHSVAKGDIDLSKLDTDAARAESVQETDNEEPAETSARVLEPVKEALGERVQAVRASKRLVDSPACLVIEEHDMALHMQRLLKEAGQSIGVSKPILELNLEHPLVKRLAAQEPASEGFSELSLLLFEQALLAEGGQLEDPASFVRRMNHALLAEG